MRRAVEMGMDGLEHVRITGADFLARDEAAGIDPLPLPAREPMLWARIDMEQAWVRDLVHVLAARRVTLDPTLIVDEVGFGEQGHTDFDHPDNRYLSRPTYERWVAVERWTAEHVPSLMRVPEALRRAAHEMLGKRGEFVRRCAEAGVRIVAGTDGVGLGRLLPGFALHHELELLRASGLSPFAVLRAATIEAAYALRMNDEIGSIVPGKRADLAVWTLDPLVSHLRPRDLDAVWVRGESYTPSTLLSGQTAPCDTADKDTESTSR